MGQYTDKVMEYMEIMEYIEEGDKIYALEAGGGRMTKWFNHGGTHIEFLRDGIEYDGVVYNKGDVIETVPLDDLYIHYNEKYNNVTPLFESIKKLFRKSDNGDQS
jgi:hypothetical protein